VYGVDGTSSNYGLAVRNDSGGNNLLVRNDGQVILSSGGLEVASTTLLSTSVSLSNGAASGSGTLTNAPTSGNPTKWIPINDNGTTRYIPAW
jgi:hypothetical protein